MAFKKFESEGRFEERMFKGSWECADCGKEITELPFEPASDKTNLLSRLLGKKKNRKIQAVLDAKENAFPPKEGFLV